MNEVKPLNRKILLAAAGIVLIVGLIGLALKLDLLTTPKSAADGPPQTVTFKDGGTLEILGVSLGERVVEISPRKWFFLRFFSGSKGSSGGTYGGLRIKTESEDGKVICCRLRSDSPAAMLMEFRMKESSGAEMRLSSYLTQRLLVSHDTRIVGKGGPSGFFQPKDDSVPTLRAEMVRTALQVLIQHRDPQSGWINFMGPSMYHEPWPDRYIAALTAWQRNLPTLECRVIRLDGEVAEFSLVNPDYRKSPVPGAAKALPQVHSGGNYTLTARTVERFATPGDHPFSRVELDLLYGGMPVERRLGDPVSFEGGTVEDEWGNVANFQWNTIRKKSGRGAFLPAGSKRMTLKLTVVRTPNSPRYATTGFPVLDGVVSADGLSVEFKPLPDAVQFGIGKMPVGRINPVGPAWEGNVPKDWKELSFKVSGENSSKEFEALESRLGRLGQWQFLIFPEGSSESAGVLTNRGGSGHGIGAGRSHFEEQVNWLSPPAMLVPGAKIRVGVHGPLKNDDVRFDLELPALIQPR